MNQRTAEQRAWYHMIGRCEQPNDRSFADYGGRGIAICPRWRSSFAAFLADIGPKPSPKHSLDRIDNYGNYEPGNCRWATRQEQAQNKRNNVVIEFEGKALCLFEWARRTGLPPVALWLRLFRRKWPVEKALTEPLKPMNQRGITHAGETMSVAAWARRVGLPAGALRLRLFRRGWSVERALSEPLKRAAA